MSEKREKNLLQRSEKRNYGIISLFVLVVLLWISPYSPIYRYITHTDLVCYKVMARGLLSGKIPYKDLFDHKGPLTYLVYAIGFLLPGNLNIGVWILCWIINCVGFIYAYKCNRLFFNEDTSLFATILILLVNTLTVFNIFLTGSMPDNLVLAPLMASTYLFLKETKEKDFSHIPDKSIFVIGLMCGLIFMTKLNICMFYLVFVGGYLLWLLTRKKIIVFLRDTGLFLLGIAVVCLPFLVFLGANHALSEFVDVYFRFNLNYGKDDLSINFWGSTSIPAPAKISMTILLLLSVMVIALKGKGMDLQRKIMTGLAVITFVVLSLPDNIVYFYIVFVPLYVLAFGVISEFLLALVGEKTNAVQLSAIVIVVQAIMLGMQTYLCGSIKLQKTEKELALEAFSEAHPDATCMSFFKTTVIGYYDYCTGTPAFRVFYQPPIATDELVQEQIDELAARLPDTVVYIGVSDEAYDSQMCRFIEQNGYVLYGVFDEDYDAEYFYVREEFLV
ncbi:MAG: glycosyltransferase family 39 protein [Clostridiales bacterium]|nr:glycosyltransferase family 39 protein [Clostridiales bacterium]